MYVLLPTGKQSERHLPTPVATLCPGAKPSVHPAGHPDTPCLAPALTGALASSSVRLPPPTPSSQYWWAPLKHRHQKHRRPLSPLLIPPSSPKFREHPPRGDFARPTSWTSATALPPKLQPSGLSPAGAGAGAEPPEVRNSFAAAPPRRACSWGSPQPRCPPR